MEKILYLTDFSEVADRALDFVVQMKDCGEKNVVMLHVVDARDLTPSFGWDRSVDPKKLEEGLEDRAAHKMEALKERLEQFDFTVRVRIEIGIPLQEIIRIQSEEAISDIIMGSHGVTNVKEMVLGSVAEKVMRKSSCNVHIIRRE